MENILINKTEQQNTNAYIFARIIEPFKPLFIIDENLQRLLAKSMLIEDQKHRINVSLTMLPKKILRTNTINFRIKENIPISRDTNTNVNIALSDDSSLKFYVVEGINI